MHKVGIIGYGGMATYHAAQIAEMENIAIKSIYDVQESRQKAAMEKNFIVYATAQDLLDDPEIDIVTIATPNDSHLEYIKQSLRAGKHVLCEKPVTMNPAELQEAIKVRDETGKLFTINQNRRKDPDYVGIKEMIRSKKAGELRVIESRVIGSRGLSYGWRCKKVTGGGILLDWGVHMIDQLLTLVDSKVSYVFSTMRFETYQEVDDTFHLIIGFENGVIGIVEVETNDFIGKMRWHVQCADGSMQIKDWGEPIKLIVPTNAEFVWSDEIIQTKLGPSRTMIPRRPQEIEVTETPLPEVQNGVQYNYQKLMDAIEGKGEIAVTAEEALRTARVIEAAFQSAETHQTVQLNI